MTNIDYIKYIQNYLNELDKIQEKPILIEINTIIIYDLNTFLFG